MPWHSVDVPAEPIDGATADLHCLSFGGPNHPIGAGNAAVLSIQLARKKRARLLGLGPAE
jgi:hypothetical protein